MKEDKIKEEVLKEFEKEDYLWSIEDIFRRHELNHLDKKSKEWINYFGFHKAIDLTIKKCQKQKREQVEWLKESKRILFQKSFRGD